MVNRSKPVRIDDEIEEYITNMQKTLQNLGFRNPSKKDALRCIIQMNAASNLKVKRAAKKKKAFMFL